MGRTANYTMAVQLFGLAFVDEAHPARPRPEHGGLLFCHCVGVRPACVRDLGRSCIHSREFCGAVADQGASALASPRANCSVTIFCRLVAQMSAPSADTVVILIFLLLLYAVHDLGQGRRGAQQELA